jgi:hypothetical protein
MDFRLITGRPLNGRRPTFPTLLFFLNHIFIPCERGYFPRFFKLKAMKHRYEILGKLRSLPDRSWSISNLSRSLKLSEDIILTQLRYLSLYGHAKRTGRGIYSATSKNNK